MLYSANYRGVSLFCGDSAFYVALARVFGDRRVPAFGTLCWVAMLVFGFADLYPIRNLI